MYTKTIAVLLSAFLFNSLAAANEQVITQTPEGRWHFIVPGGKSFSGPVDIAVDSSGNVFVVEQRNSRISKFAPSGELITTWGKPGSGDGRFLHPSAIAADRSDCVYVADTLNHRIQKFDNNGQFLMSLHSDALVNPCDLAADNDTLYVADSNTRSIYAFDFMGNRIDDWVVKKSFFTVLQNISLSLDGSGNIMAFGLGRELLQLYSPGGKLLEQWTPEVTGTEKRIFSPGSLSVDADGYLYLIDKTDQCIYVFPPEQHHRRGFVWKLATDNPLETWWPAGMAFGRDGIIYVADEYNDRIQLFSRTKLIQALQTQKHISKESY